MVSTQAVTGEEAGSRDTDKLMWAECHLGGTEVSSAFQRPPSWQTLPMEVGREVRGRPEALPLGTWSDLEKPQKPRGPEPLMPTLENRVPPPHTPVVVSIGTELFPEPSCIWDRQCHPLLPQLQEGHFLSSGEGSR